MAKKILHDKVVDIALDDKLEAVFISARNKVNAQLDGLLSDIKTKQKEISNAMISSESIKKQDQITQGIGKMKEAKKQLNAIERERAKIQKNLAAAIAKTRAYDKGAAQIAERARQINNERVKTLKEEIAISRQLPGSINRINLELRKNINTYKALTAEQRKNKAVGGQLLRTIKQQRRELTRLQKPLGGIRQAFNGVVRSMKAYVAAYIGISGLMRLGRNIFETTRRLDTFDQSLKFVITDMNELYLTQQFLVELNKRYGADIVSTSESYLRFAAALKTSNISATKAREVFEKFMKVGAALGLSTRRLELIFLALEQMVSKGTVSMEELRRQLGDNLYGAFQLMAETIGVTTMELVKMIKANKVLAEEVLPEFADKVEEAYGLDSTTKIDNMTTAIGKLKGEWQLFVKALNAADTTKGALNFLVVVLNKMRRAISDDWTLTLEDTFATADFKAKGFLKTLSTAPENIEGSIESIKTKIKELQADLDANPFDSLGEFDPDQSKGFLSRKKLEELKSNAAETTNQIKILTSAIEELESKKDPPKVPGILATLNKELKEFKEERLTVTSAAEITRIDFEIQRVEELIASYDVLKNTKEALDEGVKEADDIYKEFSKDLEDQADAILDLADAEEKAAKANDKLFEKDRLKAEKEYIKSVQDLYGRLGKYKKAFYDEDVALLREKFEEQKHILKSNFDNGVMTEAEYLQAVKELERDFLEDRVKIWVQSNQAIVRQVNVIVQELSNALLSINDMAVQDAQRKADEHEKEISDLESKLIEEQRLKDEGEANNVESVRLALMEERKLRDEATEELRKTKEREARIELLAQTSNLITATTEIFAAHSPQGLPGILVAAGAVASMLSIIASYKAKIKSLEEVPKYAKGTEFVEGKGTGTSDSIDAKLSRGERVVDAETNKKLKGIPNDKLGALADIYRLNLPAMDENHQISGWSLLVDEMREGTEATKELLKFHKDKGDYIDLGDGRVMRVKNNSLRIYRTI